MGILLIIFVALGAAGLLLQGVMYTKQFKRNLGIRTANTVLGLVIAYISFTSFGENETARKLISLILGMSAVAGLAVSFVKRDALAGKLLLTVSVLGGLGFLFAGV